MHLLWQQFFLDFPKNKCNFLHKNKLEIVVRRVQFLRGRRPMRSFFSPEAVATIALWKSAPMMAINYADSLLNSVNWKYGPNNSVIDSFQMR